MMHALLFDKIILSLFTRFHSVLNVLFESNLHIYMYCLATLKESVMKQTMFSQKLIINILVVIAEF